MRQLQAFQQGTWFPLLQRVQTAGWFSIVTEWIQTVISIQIGATISYNSDINFYCFSTSFGNGFDSFADSVFQQLLRFPLLQLYVPVVVPGHADCFVPPNS
jgi:hypothetical protein